MKVLWFCNTPSMYKQDAAGYNGGGWIAALEHLMSRQPGIDLAIGFFHPDKSFVVKTGATTYYPISIYSSKLSKLKHHLRYEAHDLVELNEYRRIVDHFKPDIIHIFGSEKSFGLIQRDTKVPVVVHIQGILTPYLNAMFAPGTNASDYFRYMGVKRAFKKIIELGYFTHNAKREESILRDCKYFMGRTHWDKDITSLYAPKAKYFHCNENLRSDFYEALPWRQSDRDKITLVTTISETDYKGFDLILKTAKILKTQNGVHFEWLVFGIHKYSFWERKLNIKSGDMNVTLKGVASSADLIAALQNSSMYIHPSYIDNSPNSLCEAQLIGLPIIATNVGGISSLIEDFKTGVLIPANDPYSLASKIVQLANNPKLAETLGKQSRKVALERHDPKIILEQNLNIYHSILESAVCC